jgi:hypothetical protein
MTSYLNEYKLLKSIYKEGGGSYVLPDSRIRITTIPFESHNHKILPGEDLYKCREHHVTFDPEYTIHEDSAIPANDLILVNDSKISENRLFTIPVFTYPAPVGSRKAIILFHGLNEKSWDKYLPWAKTLAEKTKSTVILFPIAFHMNRARQSWGIPRSMEVMRRERLQKYPSTINSSFANAAISARLHYLPQRFFWSGLQTFSDVIQLVKGIRAGEYSFLDADAKIHFFAYSIGAFLTEILLMSNPEGLFTDSKLFIFAGGPVFNRMSAVTKYIIDSEANLAIYSTFSEHLEKYLLTDKRLGHYFGEDHPEGLTFRSMLNYNLMKEYREKRLMELSKKIYAVGLKKDTVIPVYEMLNTLKGAERKIPVRVKVMDFPYDYSHENPFPVSGQNEEQVDQAFRKVFQLAARFLGNP